MAMLVLVLPWAGCEYIRQTEQGLRENQQELLAWTADNIAATLGEPVARITAGHPDNTKGVLYLAPLRRPPALDGYAADWLPARSPRSTMAGAQSARLLAATFAASVFVYAQVADTAAALQLVLVDEQSNARTLTINLAERGGSAPLVTPLQPGFGPIEAVVEPQDGAVNVEIRLPLGYARRGLGVRVFNIDGNDIAASFAGEQPPAPIQPSRALSRTLERYADNELKLMAVSSAYFVLASAGQTRKGNANQQESDWLPPRLLSWILADNATDRPLIESVETIRGPLIDSALGGQAEAARVATDDPLAADVIAAVPVRHDGRVVGALVATRHSDAELLSANQALQRLALTTVGLTIGTIVLIAGYAAWLSLRIRRLARAADAAIDARGRLTATMPGSRAGDEIGDLSRSVEALLARVSENTDYLRSLAGRLSHELSTPLSIVSSSLDNLEATELAAEQHTFAQRARGGIERLRGILAAMREANRIEDVVANATFINLDVNELMNGIVSGYRGAYPGHQFTLNSDGQALAVHAAPALLVQLIDKLIDNAVSFAPAGSVIELRATRRGAAALLSVSNDGPTLSGEQLESIFGSLVSYRENGSGAHLGFGLYIAALIAGGHNGRLAASNRDDGSGVTFSLLLPIRSG